MNVLKMFARKKSGEDRPKDVRPPFRFSGGTNINPDSAMQVAAFHRGLIYIATQIAKLPWEVKDYDNKVLVTDPLSFTLKTAVSEEMSSFFFRIYMITCALTWGNGYAEIERDMMGRVKALWPIDPRRVTPDRTQTGKLVYKVSTSEFNGGNTVEQILLPKEIFHIRNFHTLDGITGQGLVAYAAETLGISSGADRFANSLFANGGMPSGTLTIQGTLSDEAYKRMEEQWKSNNSGRKVGGTAILEEGTKYEPISLAPEVMQFLESRKFSVVEIARFLGLPPSKLFDTDVATYANIEQSNLEVATDTLDSWARNFETEADIKLLNNGYGGKRTEMDLYAIFRGDMSSRSTYFTKMMQAGAITPNQIRKKEGMEPYEGGERYYIAANNLTPSDRLDEVIDAQVAPPPTAAPSPEKEKEKEKPEKVEEDEAEDEISLALVEFLKSRSRG